MKRIFVLLMLLVAGLNRSFSQNKWDDSREIVLDTYEQPIPFKMEEKIFVAYELHITNFGLDSLFIKSIKVFTDDSEVPFKTYSGEHLDKSISRIKVPTSTRNDTIIHIGQRAILHAMLSFTSDRVPKKLSHQVEYSFVNNKQKTIMTKGGTISINQQDKALVISAPVGEGIWRNSNGVEDGFRGHRNGAIRPLNGIPYQKQKYAIDFIRYNEKGEAYQGKTSDNRSWFGYDSDVLAVADARVAEVLDNVPECQPFIPDEERLAKITNLSGNYIILNIGNSIYAFYGHLKPGSILVKKGDQVKKGQLIAKLGNSGNSTAPHLHFAINRHTPIRGEAIPYVFESYEYLGEAPVSAPLGSITKSIEDDIVSRLTERLGDEGSNELLTEMFRRTVRNSMPKTKIPGSTVDYSKKGEMKTEMSPKANSMIRFIKSKPE